MSHPGFYFNPKAQGFEVFLGKTEAKIMKLAWQEKKITVKKAIFLLDSKNAYTTILTVISRLYKKGFLKRKKVGRVYEYYPTDSQEKFLSERLTTVKNCLKQFK